MTHTRIYHGNDSEFTEALASYYHFRDDARFGGWQNYLQRSDDFIRFCCHMHISEMLSARGGAGETRVVWQLVGMPIKPGRVESRDHGRRKRMFSNADAEPTRPAADPPSYRQHTVGQPPARC